MFALCQKVSSPLGFSSFTLQVKVFSSFFTQALFTLLLLLAAGTVHAETSAHAKPSPATPLPKVLFSTDMGNFTVELYPNKAPATVASFLKRVRNYYYDGLIFHRVMKNFMIQTGGYKFDLYSKDPGDTVINESHNGLKNKRGTLAMARHADPDSARAQFFINLNNNRHLNSRGKKPGYTVFGKVIEGMKVADAISKVKVRRALHFAHLPKNPVRILRIREISPAKHP